MVTCSVHQICNIQQDMEKSHLPKTLSFVSLSGVIFSVLQILCPHSQVQTSSVRVGSLPHFLVWLPILQNTQKKPQKSQLTREPEKQRRWFSCPKPALHSLCPAVRSAYMGRQVGAASESLSLCVYLRKLQLADGDQCKMKIPQGSTDISSCFLGSFLFCKENEIPTLCRTAAAFRGWVVALLS